MNLYQKSVSEELIGEHVLVFCMNYIYTGVLIKVDQTVVVLDQAAIVYETGALDSNEFTNAEKLAHKLFIGTISIESMTKTNKRV